MNDAGLLGGLRVLDLSRVLAGPFCTQILGDLGADIIKIERPGQGDDTRKWGPPFLKDDAGNDTTESAYYLSCNRNKRSVAVDITTPAGQEIIHALLEKSDVLIENFKVGGLEKYGLGWEQVRARHPHIIYAAITGFGQTGPLASEPGYDLMAQALGGLMAITGEPAGAPMKVGVAVSDVITGLYAAAGILAALHKRKETGRGELIDLALVDCTLSTLTNVAQYYLTAGTIAPRWGNAHSTIVPYEALPAADGWMIVAVGNDAQFARFAALLGKKEWAGDARFATNAARVENRATLMPLIEALMKQKPVAHWTQALRDADIPGGPVNRVDQAFAMEQVEARGMKAVMQHPVAGAPVTLVGSPLHLENHPVTYRHAPPVCGADTVAVLRELLGYDDDAIQTLAVRNIVEAA